MSLDATAYPLCWPPGWPTMFRRVQEAYDDYNHHARPA